MKRFVFALLAVGGLVGGAEAGTATVYSGNVARSTPLVRLHTPTRSEPRSDDVADVKPKVIYKTRTIERPVYIRIYESRAERRKRAIGHRYTGFKKQYRGYKYPF